MTTRGMFVVVAFWAALAGSTPGCSEATPPQEHGALKLGEGIPSSVWYTGSPTLVGVANATTTLFDTTAGGTVTGKFRFVERVLVAGQCDQTITITHQVQFPLTSTTWVSAAGSAASTTFTASTTNIMETVAMGPELRIQAVTTTAPTTCKLGIKLLYASPKAN